MHSVLFSSETPEWGTPKTFFDELDKVHNFTLDVCANKENAKCLKYFTKQEDGLRQKWTGVCWMNPPYGRGIEKWVKKAYESVVYNDATKIVCLLPARTDTVWFHDYCLLAQNLEFIRGRIKFDGGKYSAPFPSMIVIFEEVK